MQSLFFFFLISFVCLLLAVLGLGCCVGASSNCSELDGLFHCHANFSLKWLLVLRTEAWWATARGLAKSQTRLRDQTTRKILVAAPRI